MTEQTTTRTTPRWYISPVPTEGARVVLVLATGGWAGEQGAAEASSLRVVRLGNGTGRGTVQNTRTQRKTQMVRGRHGWCLANGHADAVLFATEIRETSDGVLLFGDDTDGDVVCEPSFAPTYGA